MKALRKALKVFGMERRRRRKSQRFIKQKTTPVPRTKRVLREVERLKLELAAAGIVGRPAEKLMNELLGLEGRNPAVGASGSQNAQ